MTLYEPKKTFWRILYLILIGLLRIWNPCPRRLKAVRDGNYVLDIRGRRLSNKIQKRELVRRKLAGEEERQCFRISQKGSVVMSGSTK